MYPTLDNSSSKTAEYQYLPIHWSNGVYSSSRNTFSPSTFRISVGKGFKTRKKAPDIWTSLGLSFLKKLNSQRAHSFQVIGSIYPPSMCQVHNEYKWCAIGAHTYGECISSRCFVCAAAVDGRAGTCREGVHPYTVMSRRSTPCHGCVDRELHGGGFDRATLTSEQLIAIGQLRERERLAREAREREERRRREDEHRRRHRRHEDPHGDLRRARERRRADFDRSQANDIREQERRMNRHL